MIVNIKTIDDKYMPEKGSEEAACYDVRIREIICNTDSCHLVTVLLGFSTEIEKGYKGVIVPRSSFTQKGWIMANSPGQVDSDYRGEWMIKFECLDYDTNAEFPYKEGDRVAQIYFEKEEKVIFNNVEYLEETSRGEGGFGSTGVI